MYVKCTTRNFFESDCHLVICGWDFWSITTTVLFLKAPAVRVCRSMRSKVDVKGLHLSAAELGSTRERTVVRAVVCDHTTCMTEAVLQALCKIQNTFLCGIRRKQRDSLTDSSPAGEMLRFRILTTRCKKCVTQDEPHRFLEPDRLNGELQRCHTTS